MSRIGKAPITVPAGVDVKVSADNIVTVKGPKGELHQPIQAGFNIKLENNVLTIERPNDEKQNRAERLIPPQMHEVENDEHELHRREDDEHGDDQPLRERQINADDFHAGDYGEEHRDLDVDLIFTNVVRIVVRGSVGVGGGCAHEGIGNDLFQILEQVDGREDYDPHDIDEMPVETHALDVDGVVLVEIDRTGVAGEANQNAAAHQ